MILVKTRIRKFFNIVESKKEIIDEIKNILGEDYKKIIQEHWKHGYIKKRTQYYETDEIDNVVYVSNIFFKNIKSQKICFEDAKIFFEKLRKANFEVKIEIKNVSDILAKEI